MPHFIWYGERSFISTGKRVSVDLHLRRSTSQTQNYSGVRKVGVAQSFELFFGLMTYFMYFFRIECQYLTPEKVLLDSRFNARIAGVGKSHFNSHNDAETNHGAFHRSLSYLDIHLRSKEEIHPKNVLWSFGRCMLS